MKNLAVGHFYNEPFVAACEPFVPRISEVFFAWPGVISCRPAPEFTDDVRAQLYNDLAWARSRGILLDTLFNCNCYGDEAVSPQLKDLVLRTLDDMAAHDLAPDIVTTTSPFVATVLRRHAPSVKIRLSVNMRVHGTTGLECISELFDSFYVSREHHRDLAFLRHAAEWARANGKQLGLQVNSGCLRQCPFQTFHDNLHGHNRRAQSAVGRTMDFSVFRCRTNYQRGNWEDFIRATWIRPEDVPAVEPFVDVVKLATRRIANPSQIVAAYANYSFDGNLLDLMDPVHSTVPNAPRFNNKAFPRDFFTTVSACPNANNCLHCGRCATILQQVTH